MTSNLRISWLSNVFAVTSDMDAFVEYTRTYHDHHDPRKLI